MKNKKMLTTVNVVSNENKDLNTNIDVVCKDTKDINTSVDVVCKDSKSLDISIDIVCKSEKSLKSNVDVVKSNHKDILSNVNIEDPFDHYDIKTSISPLLNDNLNSKSNIFSYSSLLTKGYVRPIKYLLSKINVLTFDRLETKLKTYSFSDHLLNVNVLDNTVLKSTLKTFKFKQVLSNVYVRSTAEVLSGLNVLTFNSLKLNLELHKTYDIPTKISIFNNFKYLYTNLDVVRESYKEFKGSLKVVDSTSLLCNLKVKNSKNTNVHNALINSSDYNISNNIDLYSDMLSSVRVPSYKKTKLSVSTFKYSSLKSVININNENIENDNKTINYLNGKQKILKSIQHDLLSNLKINYNKDINSLIKVQTHKKILTSITVSRTEKINNSIYDNKSNVLKINKENKDLLVKTKQFNHSNIKSKISLYNYKKFLSEVTVNSQKNYNIVGLKQDNEVKYKNIKDNFKNLTTKISKINFFKDFICKVNQFSYCSLTCALRVKNNDQSSLYGISQINNDYVKNLNHNNKHLKTILNINYKINKDIATNINSFNYNNLITSLNVSSDERLSLDSYKQTSNILTKQTKSKIKRLETILNVDYSGKSNLNTKVSSFDKKSILLNVNISNKDRVAKQEGYKQNYNVLFDQTKTNVDNLLFYVKARPTKDLKTYIKSYNKKSILTNVFVNKANKNRQLLDRNNIGLIELDDSFLNVKANIFSNYNLNTNLDLFESTNLLTKVRLVNRDINNSEYFIEENKNIVVSNFKHEEFITNVNIDGNVKFKVNISSYNKESLLTSVFVNSIDKFNISLEDKKLSYGLFKPKDLYSLVRVKRTPKVLFKDEKNIYTYSFKNNEFIKLNNSLTKDLFMTKGIKIDNISNIEIKDSDKNLKLLINSEADNSYDKLFFKGLTQGQLVKPSDYMDLRTISNINHINVNTEMTEDTTLRIVLNINNEDKWMAHNGQEWIEVDVNDEQEVIDKGMTLEEVNSLEEEWEELSEQIDWLRFAYYLDQESLTSVLEVDDITINVDMRGHWRKAVKGEDYNYRYYYDVKEYRFNIEFFEDGNYKINRVT